MGQCIGCSVAAKILIRSYPAVEQMSATEIDDSDRHSDTDTQEAKGQLEK